MKAEDIIQSSDNLELWLDSQWGFKIESTSPQDGEWDRKFSSDTLLKIGDVAEALFRAGCRLQYVEMLLRNEIDEKEFNKNWKTNAQ